MKKKTNLKKGIVAASMVAGLAGGLVAGLALGVPGFAGAQANNAPVAIESNASTLAKAASVTLSNAATSDDATASTIPGTVRTNSSGMGEGHGGEGHGPRGPKFEAAAKALGMTAEELKAELMAGKTIAQVATAKGVAISTVTDALVAEFKAHLDEEVASGEHTQAEADAKLAKFTARVADMVNNVRPAGGPGMGKGEGHGPRGMGEGHGPRGGGRHGGGHDAAMSSAPTLQGEVTTSPAANA